MIVIGADTHKRSHALAAVDAATGAVVAQDSITADPAGHLKALRWALPLDNDRVWALEDCRHVSGRLEQALVMAGERVIRVPPRVMGQSRRGERRVGKSDQIDALAVARAVLREGVERFPVAFLDERAMEIRLLADHRGDLVGERTRIQNRLRWHLLDLCADLEAKLPLRSLDQPRTLDRITRKLGRLPASNPRVRIARQLVSSIRQLTRQTDAIETELRTLVRAHSPRLLNETGCGVLTAATLIGRTAAPSDSPPKRASPIKPAPPRFPPPPATAPAIDSTAAATASSTARCTRSPSPARDSIPKPRTTSSANLPKARRAKKPSAASSATSPAASTDCSLSSKMSRRASPSARSPASDA
jgi:transposase